MQCYLVYSLQPQQKKGANPEYIVQTVQTFSEEHQKFSPKSWCRSLRTWTLQSMTVGPGQDAQPLSNSNSEECKGGRAGVISNIFRTVIYNRGNIPKNKV